MVYKWKSACYIRGDAQKAGEVCSQLESEGRLTPSELVNVSRDEDAPLHGMFTWDDSVAAEKWRMHEARHIIHCLVTVVGDNAEHVEPVRAFVSIRSEDEKPRFERIDYVLRNATSRNAMLHDARMDALTFRKKYGHLSELAEVFKAMDEFVGSLLEDKDEGESDAA